LRVKEVEKAFKGHVGRLKKVIKVADDIKGRSNKAEQNLLNGKGRLIWSPYWQ